MCEYDCDEHCQEHVVTKRENLALDDELKQNKSAYLKAVETIHELKDERDGLITSSKMYQKESKEKDGHIRFICNLLTREKEITEDLREKMLERDEIINECYLNLSKWNWDMQAYSPEARMAAVRVAIVRLKEKAEG